MTGIEEGLPTYQKSVFSSIQSRYEIYGDINFWYTNMYRLVSSAVPRGAKKVLDIGCGLGLLSIMLAERGFHVTGVDKSIDNINLAKRNAEAIPKVEFSVLDVEDDTLPSGFDAAVLCSILEHIRDDKKLLKEVSRSLTSQGVIVILVPAHPGLYSAFDRAVHHCRRYSARELVRKLEIAGFSIERLSYWNLVSLPTAILSSLIGRNVYPPTFLGRGVLDTLLDQWFETVENRTPFSIGLNLLVVGRKLHTGKGSNTLLDTPHAR